MVTSGCQSIGWTKLDKSHPRSEHSEVEGWVSKTIVIFTCVGLYGCVIQVFTREIRSVVCRYFFRCCPFFCFRYNEVIMLRVNCDYELEQQQAQNKTWNSRSHTEVNISYLPGLMRNNYMLSPPQVLITCPVIYELMSLAKKTTVFAISSAEPNLPSGIFFRYSAAAAPSCK